MKENYLMLVFVAGVLAVPKAIELVNRVLEEYVIPPLVTKRTLKDGDDIFPVGLDLALSKGEIQKLRECGALDILDAGQRRHRMIASAGQAHVCNQCKRLHQ